MTPTSPLPDQTLEEIQQEGYCQYGVCEPGEKHAPWCSEYTSTEIKLAAIDAQMSKKEKP